MSVRLLRLGLGLVASASAGAAADNDAVRYEQLRHAVLAQEQARQTNVPAHQILFELGWMRSSTRDAVRIRERTDALEAALADPANLGVADSQSPETGMWGRWYRHWFFKLDASYEEISRLEAEHRSAPYPCRFLDEINAPDRLKAHLDRLLVTDRSSGGENHRREFNETAAALIRLIHRGWPSNYHYHPQLDSALVDWLMNTARDPVTGYWGERYRRVGKLTNTTDLSITFHIVSYLDGAVPDWPKILETTLAIKGREYPGGWLSSGQYLSHNNLDVARLFELGWKFASEPQRAAIRAELRRMLDWCLRESLRSDGSFAITPDDDSVETTEYFGAVFLARVGYFDRARRYWTEEDFPGSEPNRARIVQFIHLHMGSGGEGGAYYRSALASLQAGARSGERTNPLTGGPP